MFCTSRSLFLLPMGNRLAHEDQAPAILYGVVPKGYIVTLLNTIIQNAKSQIKSDQASVPNNARNSAAGALSTVTRDSSGVVTGAIQSTLGTATKGVNNAVNTGLKSVTGAAQSALTGDFNGALTKLTNGPGDVLSSLSSSFGLSKGASLKGPSLPFGLNTGGGGITPAGFTTGGDLASSSSPSDVNPGNSLAGAMARSDPMLSFCWYAILPDMAPQGGSPKTLPWYYVEEATPPFRTFDQRSIFREGRQRHYPSTYSVDSLRLAIYMDSSNVALNYLQAWNGALLAPTTSQTAYRSGGAYGTPGQYKKTIKIYLLNVAKQQLAVLEYIECWPQTLDAYSLDSNTSSRIINHVTFSVGDVFVNIYDISKTAAAGFNVNGNNLPLSLDVGEQFVTA